MSVSNQKIITIHQTSEVPFVKIGIKEVREAFSKMPPATFMLYLYLAGNKEGFPLELSPTAFKNAMGYSRSSYYRAVDDLMKLGYIYEDNGHLNFATSPKVGTKGVVQNWEKDDSKMKQPIIKDETKMSQNCNEDVSDMDIEINKKENIENKKIKNPKPSDYSYLEKRISPLGEYDGKWLEDEVEGLWSMTKFAQVGPIVRNTEFSINEADYIAYHILDPEARSKYKRTDIIGFLKS